MLNLSQELHYSIQQVFNVCGVLNYSQIDINTMNTFNHLTLSISLSISLITSAQDHTLSNQNEYSIKAFDGRTSLSKAKQIDQKLEDLALLTKFDSNHSFNPRIEKSSGIGVGIGGPTIIGPFISYSEFISPNVNLELGVSFLGFFTGARYHLGGQKENRLWTPYLGTLIGIGLVKPNSSTCKECNSTATIGPFLYIPTGIEFISKGGFNLNTEVGLNTGLTSYTAQYFTASLKLGYRW